MDMVKSQAEQVRAVEKSMKRLTAKVDMIDAKSDEILLAMSVVLEQLQLQQQPVRDYHGTELEASQRLDQAAQRLARYQSYPGTSSVSRGASRNSSFAREPKRTLSFSPGKERRGVEQGGRKPSFEKNPKQAEEAPYATLATLRPCGSDPYRRDDDERSGVSSRSGASFRSDGSRKGLRTAVG